MRTYNNIPFSNQPSQKNMVFRSFMSGIACVLVAAPLLASAGLPPHPMRPNGLAGAPGLYAQYR